MEAQGVALLLFWGILYFIPTMIASHRQHHQYSAIFLLNLLLGWSGLGWIIALVWSATAVEKKQ